MNKTSIRKNLHNFKVIDNRSLLFVIIACTVSSWIISYHWKRRNLYRHAAKLKGPRSYPLIGSCHKFLAYSTEELFINITKLFEEYPEISKLWLGNRLVCFISKPEYLEIILNSPYCLDKSSLFRYVREVIGSGLISAPVQTWKKHRRMISPAFNQKLLNEFVDVFREQNNIAVDNLAEELDGSEIDISSVITRINLYTVCENIMGIKMDNNNESIQGSELGKWIDLLMMVVFLRTAVIWYQIDFIFNMSKLSKIYHEAKTNLYQFTKKIIRDKREIYDRKMMKIKNGEEIEESELNRRSTFLDILLDLSDKGVKLTNEELQQEVDTFTIAGTDTTATTISFCLIMLGMHPDLQQKIFEEVKDVLGQERNILAEDLPQLKFMERFIKETLRLFPAGPYLYRASEADINLGEYVVPAYSKIALGIFVLHRNEKYWKDPLKFDPDRFLPEEIAKRHPYSFLAFSGGPRNCIGYKYAMMAMKVSLATFIQKFVIMTPYKSIEDIKLKCNLVLRPSDGFKVSFQLREPKN